MREFIAVMMVCGALAACGYGNDGQAGSEMQTASGGGGSIDIMSPQDGAKVTANQPVALQYKVNTSSNGDHVHISVDGGRPEVVKQLEGTFKTKPLAAGQHTITIKEVTGGHSPTGVQASISVQAGT